MAMGIRGWTFALLVLMVGLAMGLPLSASSSTPALAWARLESFVPGRHPPLPPPPPQAAAEAPACAPEEAEPPVKWKRIEIAASIIGAGVALVLSMAPLIYHLHNQGSMTKTLQLFSVTPMNVGLGNAISWALYALAVLKRDKCFDVVMTNLLSAMANLNFLVFVWVSKRETTKGYITLIVSLLSFIGMFVLQQMTPKRTKTYEYLFGSIGCVTLFVGHYYQLKDIIRNCTTKSQTLSVICNVIPNMLLSIVSILIVRLRHPEQKFIAVSSWINAGLFVIEILMILNKRRLRKLLAYMNLLKTDGDSPDGDIELGLQVNQERKNLKRKSRSQGDNGLPPVKCKIIYKERPLLSNQVTFGPSISATPERTVAATSSSSGGPSALTPRPRDDNILDPRLGKKKSYRKWLSLGCH